MVIFFFQAEDGIRDLVRSRGLVDVYKRQRLGSSSRLKVMDAGFVGEGRTKKSNRLPSYRSTPVSYTHLTLPTSDLV